MLVFENAGSLPPDLITTFGASVKDSSAIGYFGTGLKYAIAACLRMNQHIHIYSNGDLYEFSLEEKIIRGKTFQIILMNGVSLGMTTEYGKNWEPWMVFRELYTNMLDEGGKLYKAEHITADPANTYIVVAGQLLEAEYEKLAENFIPREKIPLYTTSTIEIYEGASQYLYYKGIRVAEEGTIFHYNLKQNIILTEDRTLRSLFDFNWALVLALKTCTNPTIIRRVASAHAPEYEKNLYWENGEAGEIFIETIIEMYKEDAGSLNPKLLNLLRAVAPDLLYPEISLSKIETKMLDRALAFCAELNFPVVYPVRVVETLGAECLALARTDLRIIILSRRCFAQGTRLVAQALIEEVIHIREGLSDCTRELQTYLFEKIVSLGEELRGDPL